MDALHKTKSVEPAESEEIEQDFISFFTKVIEDSKTGKRVISSGKSNGSRYSYNSIKNYAVTLAAVRRYMDYKHLKSLSFEAVNKAFYDDFRFFATTSSPRKNQPLGSTLRT